MAAIFTGAEDWSAARTRAGGGGQGRTDAERSHGGALGVDLVDVRYPLGQRVRRDLVPVPAHSQPLSHVLRRRREREAHLYRNSAASACALTTCALASAAGHPHQLWMIWSGEEGGTDEAGHDASDVGRDPEQVRDRARIQQLILVDDQTKALQPMPATRSAQARSLTGIFFWVATTQLSGPRMATAVWPEFVIALNAYSTW